MSLSRADVRVRPAAVRPAGKTLAGRWRALRAGWSAWVATGRRRWQLLVAVFSAIRLVGHAAMTLVRSVGRLRRAGARLFGRRA